MNYPQTLDYLFAQLPMYQRVGPSAYKKDLSNIIHLCKTLNNPERSFKSIHLAGTNGKGSTSHMLASVLQTNNYKTGLYTSPHLIDFRERIKVNGIMVTESFVCDFVQRIKGEFTAIKPSFFEITVAMAFDWFRDQEVDIAVVETGLGGRLDSTNILYPELCVITNIGYDHMDMLGESLIEIAIEKAGIIKRGVPVVIGEFNEEVHPIFIQKTEELNCKIIRADEVNEEKFETDLGGNFQRKNLQTCVAALETLTNLGFNLSTEKIKKGLLNVVRGTGFQGRWQKLSNSPFTICDTGHNVDGIGQIAIELKDEDFEQLHIVFGSVTGKDVQEFFKLLPNGAIYYFCAADIPRAMPVKELMLLADEAGIKGLGFTSVASAYLKAKAEANNSDMIFIGGSTFVIADLLVFLNRLDVPFSRRV